MKIKFLALILLIPTITFGQSSDSIKLRRVKIGIVYSPDYCYRLLNYHPPNNWVQDLRNDEEVAIFGYTTGLTIKVDLTKKIIFETGWLYSRRGEQTKEIELEWEISNQKFPIKSKTQYLFKYTEIPLKLNYLLSSKKIKYYISAGLSVNVFGEKETKVISVFTNGHKTSEGSGANIGYSKVNLAAIIGFGIKYDLFKQISINLEPVYRQFVNSIVVETMAKEYPYSIGVNVGILYAFKKNSG